ncbi:ATP-binding protein [Streptomyces sp. NPDC102283]|uniref:ATP-binding protein n=1 Tax=Streptomyces sp. NPDC102283 TaxID=3366155 RepID=UPI003823C3B6
MTLPESYLSGWAGRLCLPRVCVELSTGGLDGERITTALLRDLASDLDDAGALDWLLEQGEFPSAAALITESPAVVTDLEMLRDAQERLSRRETEVRAELGGEIEHLLDRAEAAGVPAPAGISDLLTDAAESRLPRLRERLTSLAEELDTDIGEARNEAKRRMTLHNRRAGVSKALFAAWEQRVKRGQLVAAERLLAVGDSEVAPPDTVPRVRAWDPTVDAHTVLERMSQRSYGGEWMPGLDGQLLLESYAALRASRAERDAEDFSATLAEFVGGTRRRPPIPCSGGYSFRFDLSSATRALPLSWLSDIRMVLHMEDESPLPDTSAEERLIVIDCGTGTERLHGRSNVAVLSPGDLIRLSTVTQHRALQLLRLLGRNWTSHALGIGSGGALEPLLVGHPEPVAWGRLSWLLDVLDLGGTELVRELIDQVGLHPNGLYILIESLLRAGGGRTRDSRRERWATIDMTSQLGAAVLPSLMPGPAGRIAFLALLAADGFGTPLQVPDLQLSVAIEGGDASEDLLKEGVRALTRHPLVDSRTEPESESGILLRRCAVLSRMRQEAPSMLLEALAVTAPSNDTQAWSGHRWALLLEGFGDHTLESTLENRARAIASCGPAPEPHDVIPTIEAVVADCRKAFPTLRVDLDLPAHASAAVPLNALRTILAEVLQNAVDELAEAQRDRVQITVSSDPDDIIIDIADDGNGVGFANPHAAFRLGRGTRGPSRGRGLFDAAELARRIDAQLVLTTQGGSHSLHGACFLLALPREPIQLPPAQRRATPPVDGAG